MKKYMKKISYGLVLTLFLGNTALASGIDWSRSIMMVEYTKESVFSPAFSCFGYSSNRTEVPTLPTTGCGNPYGGTSNFCVWEYLDVLGYSDTENDPDLDNCFQQSGVYKTSISLVDFAENLTGPTINTFTIKPGAPDPEVSTFTPNANCSDLSLIANNVDTCDIELEIKDKFGNPVTQLKNKTGKIYSDTTFANDANSGDYNFRTGTEINGSKVPSALGTALNFTIGNTDEVKTTLTITSWTPTMSKIGEFLGLIEPFNYAFHIETPTVDESGNLDLVNSEIFEFGQYTPALAFAPWAKIIPSMNMSPASFILDIEVPLNLARNIMGMVIGGPNAGVTTLLKYHLTNLDLYLEGSDVTFNALTESANVSVNANLKEVHPILKASQTGISVEGEVGFSTKVAYNITDGGLKTIQYPSGAIGTNITDAAGGDDYNSETITTEILGVSVEGKLVGNKDKGVSADSKSIKLNVTSVEDVREEIFLNSHKIARGIKPQGQPSGEVNPNKVLVFNSNWFINSNVALVEGLDVIIKSTGSQNPPENSNTLIIRNGNLIIEDDFTYNNKLDSFGIILVNDKVEKKPAKGNIFVKDNVKEFIGTIFAEGSLFTIPNAQIINETGDVTIADISNGHIPSNETQLLFTGTLLSHNTLGGAISVTGDTTFFTPWGPTSGLTSSDKNEALKYDIHFMRAYSPEYDVLSNQINGSKCVCLSGDCSMDLPPNCDSNIHAMIIRYDGKVSVNTPPGFKGAGIIER